MKVIERIQKLLGEYNTIQNISLRNRAVMFSKKKIEPVNPASYIKNDVLSDREFKGKGKSGDFQNGKHYKCPRCKKEFSASVSISNMGECPYCNAELKWRKL